MSHESRDRRVQLLAELHATIERSGWAVRTAEPDAASGRAGLGYTVGLTALGHPEVVVTGLPALSAVAVLNAVGQRVRDGADFLPGMRVADLLPVTVVVIDAVSVDGLTAVRELYGEAEAVQLVWSDGSGRFPGEAGFAAPGAQPLLGDLP
ncbi:DUF4262 domain-containing protein [Leifsonia poae]|uniref:DUF4262 domain-containing protein n=1 Tax=Leifsonia poae TaxID=110933 RepID=UPI001CBDABEC|nr:DUF4262 domain-containing protein [Leifsonia poae]